MFNIKFHTSAKHLVNLLSDFAVCIIYYTAIPTTLPCRGNVFRNTLPRVANVLLNFKALPTTLSVSVCAKCNAGVDGAALHRSPPPVPLHHVARAERQCLVAVERTRLDAKVLYQSESCCTVAWPTDTLTLFLSLSPTHTIAHT